jgi:hypothetical protein
LNDLEEMAIGREYGESWRTTLSKRARIADMESTAIVRPGHGSNSLSEMLDARQERLRNVTTGHVYLKIGVSGSDFIFFGGGKLHHPLHKTENSLVIFTLRSLSPMKDWSYIVQSM